MTKGNRTDQRPDNQRAGHKPQEQSEAQRKIERDDLKGAEQQNEQRGKAKSGKLGIKGD